MASLRDPILLLHLFIRQMLTAAFRVTQLQYITSKSQMMSKLQDILPIWPYVSPSSLTPYEMSNNEVVTTVDQSGMERIGEGTTITTAITKAGIIDLPEEILLLIFSMTSPYRDYKCIMLVCHQWNNIMAGRSPYNEVTSSIRVWYVLKFTIKRVFQPEQDLKRSSGVVSDPKSHQFNSASILEHYYNVSE